MKSKKIKNNFLLGFVFQGIKIKYYKITANLILLRHLNKRYSGFMKQSLLNPKIFQSISIKYTGEYRLSGFMSRKSMS